VLGILDGEGKLALQAGIAHAMPTGKLDGLVDRNVIVHAYQAVSPLDFSAFSMVSVFFVSRRGGVARQRGLEEARQDSAGTATGSLFDRLRPGEWCGWSGRF
jgi:hypothetical protein